MGTLRAAKASVSIITVAILLLATLTASLAAQAPEPVVGDEQSVAPGSGESGDSSATPQPGWADAEDGPTSSQAGIAPGHERDPATPDTSEQDRSGNTATGIEGQAAEADEGVGGAPPSAPAVTGGPAATPQPDRTEAPRARMAAIAAPAVTAASAVTVSDLAVDCTGTVSFTYDNPTGATQQVQILLIRADYDVQGGEFLGPGVWVDLIPGAGSKSVTVPYYVYVYTLRAQVAWGFDGDTPQTQTAQVTGCSSVVPETASMTIRGLGCSGAFTIVLDTASITRDHQYDVYLEAMTLDGVTTYLGETVTFRSTQAEYHFAPDLSGKSYVGLWVSVVDSEEGIWDVAEASVSGCAPVDTGTTQPVRVSDLVVRCDGTLTFNYTAQASTTATAGMWGVPSNGFSSGSFTLPAGSGAHEVRFGAFAEDFTEVHAGVGWTVNGKSQYVETSVSGCNPTPPTRLLGTVMEAQGSDCTAPRAVTGWAKVQQADPARHQLRIQVVEVLGATETVRSQTTVSVPGSGPYTGLINFTLASGMQTLTADEWLVRVHLVESATGVTIGQQSWVMGYACAPSDGNSFALSLTLCGQADCVPPHDLTADGATARWTVEPIGIDGQPSITPAAQVVNGMASTTAGPILPGPYRVCLDPLLGGAFDGDVRLGEAPLCRQVQLTASAEPVPVAFEVTLAPTDPGAELIRTLIRILQQILAGVAS